MNTNLQGTDNVGVVGLGLCTPLGLTARATQVEMAAGAVRFFETEALDDSGEPVRASILTLLEPGLTRTERMASLAVTAIPEALKEAASLGIERLPLLLSLPEEGSGAPFDVHAVLSALDEAAPVRLDSSKSSLFLEGRAGFFRALAEASRLLKTRTAAWVLVGGVDSMCDRDSLMLHARTGRSLGPSARDGILPGEGAGFFLLTTTTTPLKQQRLKPQAWLVGCALSHEPHSFLQRKPNLAEGLTEAFHQLRSQQTVGTRRVDHVLSCQTGESFWAQEFNYAYLRNAPLMPEPLKVSLVAESLGDIGAAAGAVQLGGALHLLKKWEPAYGDAARVLIYGCADAGQVGACIIEGGE